MRDMEYYEGQHFQDICWEGELIQNQEFVECRFDGCVLERCKFSGCRFTDCVFSQCRVAELSFEDTILLDCGFEACHLVGINWSLLLGGGFMFPITSFQNCHLKYNYFTDMNFRKFDFSQNEIVASMFGDCVLTESSFQGCELDRTEFFRCDLTRADFRQATGYQIDLETNQLKKAKFSCPEAIRLLDGLGIVVE